MADGIFGTLVANMSRLGFFQFLFPFLLALALIYGLMTWALKDRLPKSAKALIALILAFFVMVYSSWNVMIVNFFAQLSGMWLVVATGILFIVLLLAIVGFDVQDLTKGKFSKWILVLLFVAIGIILFFGAGGAWLVNVPGFAVSSDLWTVLFFIIILAVVLYFLAGEGEKKSEGAGAAK